MIYPQSKAKDEVALKPTAPMAGLDHFHSLCRCCIGVGQYLQLNLRGADPVVGPDEKPNGSWKIEVPDLFWLLTRAGV